METKGPQIATAYVQLQPTFQGVGAEIAKQFGADGEGGRSAESSGKLLGGKLVQGAKSALKGLQVAATAAFAGATAAAGAFIKDAVATGMQFDKAMSQVAATMGVTTDEVEALRDFAQEMGAKTAFSATQAAEALNYMALAGYDAETSMQMLPNVLNLAAAGNMDLGLASDMLTDSQSALGLSIEETNALVDKMAKASSKSNTSVAQLGEAILTVGGTAKNLRGGTTELTTALGILADSGIKGAEGGTLLRNSILSLTDPTNEGREALEKLGVTVFDAEGNMRSFNDIFGNMNESLSRLTQEERIEAIGAIFNKRDLKGVEALLANVGDRWNELSGYIDDSAGAAQKMADVQLDNLAGDVTILQSAWEGVKLAFSEGFSPAAREAVQSLTKQISSPQMRENMKKLGEIAGKLLKNLSNAAVKLFPELLKLFDNGAARLKTLTLAAGGLMTVCKALTGHPIGALITGLMTVGAVLAEDALFADDYDRSLEGLTERQKDAIGALADVAAGYADVRSEREKTLGGIAEEAGEAKDLWSELQKIVDANGNVKEGYEERAKFITGKLSELTGLEIQYNDGVIENYAELKDAILDTIKAKEAAAVYDEVDSAFKENQGKLETARIAVPAAQEAREAAASALQENLANYLQRHDQEDLLDQLIAGETFDDGTIFADIASFWNDWIADYREMTAEQLSEQFWDGISAEEAALYDIYTKMAGSQDYDTQADAAEMMDTLRSANQTYAEAVETERNLIEEQGQLYQVRQAYMDGDLDAVVEYAEQFSTWYIKQLQGRNALGAEELQKMKDDSNEILQQFERYRQALEENTIDPAFFDEIKEQDAEFFKAAIEAAANAAKSGDHAAQVYLESIVPMVEASGILGEEVLTALLSGLEPDEQETIKIGAQILAGMEGGLTDPMNVRRLITAGQTATRSVLDAMRITAEIASPSRATRRMGAYLAEGLQLGMEDGEADVRQEAAQLARAAMPETGSFAAAYSEVTPQTQGTDWTDRAPLWSAAAPQEQAPQTLSERAVALLERLAALAEEGQKIVLDDGTIVGVIDRRLGDLARRRERETT